MKIIHSLSLVLFAALLFSCSDSDPVTENDPRLGFRFSSDTASMYSFAVRFDTVEIFDSAIGQTYQSEYTVSNLFSPPTDTLRFTVYPPFNWVGTDANANVTLEILLNGQVIADTTGEISGFDRPGGITVSSVF